MGEAWDDMRGWVAGKRRDHSSMGWRMRVTPECRVEGIGAICSGQDHHMAARCCTGGAGICCLGAVVALFPVGHGLWWTRGLREIVHARQHLGNDTVLHLPLRCLPLGSDCINLVWIFAVERSHRRDTNLGTMSAFQALIPKQIQTWESW